MLVSGEAKFKSAKESLDTDVAIIDEMDDTKQDRRSLDHGLA